MSNTTEQIPKLKICVLSLAMITAMLVGFTGYHRLIHQDCPIPGPTSFWVIMAIASLAYGFWISTKMDDLYAEAVDWVYTLLRYGVFAIMIIAGIGLIIKPSQLLPSPANLIMGIVIFLTAGWLYRWINNDKEIS